MKVIILKNIHQFENKSNIGYDDILLKYTSSLMPIHIMEFSIGFKGYIIQ